MLKCCSWTQWKFQESFEASEASFMIWLWYRVRTRPAYILAPLFLPPCVVQWFPLEGNQTRRPERRHTLTKFLIWVNQNTAALCLAQPRHSLEDYKATGWSSSTRDSMHVIYSSPIPRLIGEEKFLIFLNSSEFLQNHSPSGIVWPFTQLRQEPRAEMQVNIGLGCETSADRL